MEINFTKKKCFSVKRLQFVIFLNTCRVNKHQLTLYLFHRDLRLNTCTKDRDFLHRLIRVGYLECGVDAAVENGPPLILIVRASKRDYARRNKTDLGLWGQTESSIKIEDLRSNKTTGNLS